MKKILTIIVFAVVISLFCFSCTSNDFDNLEGLEEFEGIYHQQFIGYIIDLKRGDTVYTSYTGANSIYKLTPDVPQGKKIGFLKANEEFNNEIYYIYEVTGYSPDEWIYLFIGNDGERGIGLLKADDVTEIPEQFENLKSEMEKSK